MGCNHHSKRDFLHGFHWRFVRLVTIRPAFYRWEIFIEVNGGSTQQAMFDFFGSRFYYLQACIVATCIINYSKLVE